MLNYLTNPIRSYVRRESHMTPRQARALADYTAAYCLPIPTQVIDFNTVFGNAAPVVLEIGFGMGESLLAQAQNYPEHNFLGIEVYRPGVGHLLADLAAHGVTNVRIIVADAVQILNHHIAEQSLQRVQLFFPDPWPKRRHHKRRIIQPGFVHHIANKLIPQGILHLATDWQHYALHMQQVLASCTLLKNTTEGFAVKPLERSASKFERRGLRLGHGVWDLIYQKSS